MSIEYEDRVNPLTAFLHEQAKKAEQNPEEESEIENQYQTEALIDEKTNSA